MERMEKQTVVDFMVEELNKSIGLTKFVDTCDEDYKKEILGIIKQGKAMQDEQMQLTWNNAIDAVQKDKWHSYYEFYNNNFKSE